MNIQPLGATAVVSFGWGELLENIESLERIARLRDSGVLTEAEFQEQKSRLLSGGTVRGADRSSPSIGSRSSSIGGEQKLDEFRGSTTRWLFGSFSGWLTLLLSLVGIGLVIILAKWWGNISSRYEITDQRLKIRTGIFIKRVDEIELYRIRDVRVDFSLINQITGIGNITVLSSDPTSQARSFVMACIPDARERRESLRSLVDAARQRRQVREIDVGNVYS